MIETYLLIFFATSGFRTSTPPTMEIFHVEAECWQALIGYANAKAIKEYESDLRWAHEILANPDSSGYQRRETTKRIPKAAREHQERLARYDQRQDLPGTCVKRSTQEESAKP